MSQGNIKLIKIKTNDTLPKPKVTVVTTDPSNPGVETPVDLTGATAKFIMVTDDDARTVIVNATADILVPATDGQIEYTWLAIDTAAAGDYLGEFEIILTTGKITLPPDDTLKIKIYNDFDGA